MTVAHNSLATNKPVALLFRIKLEFRSVGFVEGGKPENPGKKPLEQREPTTTNSNAYECGSRIKFGQY